MEVHTRLAVHLTASAAHGLFPQPSFKVFKLIPAMKLGHGRHPFLNYSIKFLLGSSDSIRCWRTVIAKSCQDNSMFQCSCLESTLWTRRSLEDITTLQSGESNMVPILVHYTLHHPMAPKMWIPTDSNLEHFWALRQTKYCRDMLSIFARACY